MASKPTLFLCGAPQSSGSTLVSWCFLQRSDMDGVLDARNDLLPELPSSSAPHAWCKFTISSFRLFDVACHFEDEGRSVRPLLVVRDVRAVFNSLVTKPYGRNGITAEEPPIRLRLRRFLRDWRHARRRGWPVIRYESYVEAPEPTLRTACEQLGLPWDPAMLTWPKPFEQIAAPGHGSPTFRRSRRGSLTETLRPDLCVAGAEHVPEDDLRWLELEFAAYNRALGYPRHLDHKPHVAGRACPRFEHTRRYRRGGGSLVRMRRALSRAWAWVWNGRVSGAAPQPRRG